MRRVCRSSVIAGKVRYYEWLAKKKGKKKTWRHVRPLLRLTESWKKEGKQKCITIRRFLLFTAIGRRRPFPRSSSAPFPSPLASPCYCFAGRALSAVSLCPLSARAAFIVCLIFITRCTGAILISSGRARRSISSVNSEGSSVCENRPHALLISDQIVELYATARNCWVICKNSSEISRRKISKIVICVSNSNVIINWKLKINMYT